jgi:hypothetical protein
MNPIAIVVLSALSDGVIAAGGVMLGGNLQGTANGSGGVPTTGVMVVAGITGLIAFFKEIKQNLQGAKDEHAAAQAGKP